MQTDLEKRELVLHGREGHWSISKTQNPLSKRSKSFSGLLHVFYMWIVKQIEVICLWLALTQPYKAINKMAS